MCLNFQINVKKPMRFIVPLVGSPASNTFAETHEALMTTTVLAGERLMAGTPSNAKYASLRVAQALFYALAIV